MRPHGNWLPPFGVVLCLLPLLLLIPWPGLGHSWIYAVAVGVWAWVGIQIVFRWIEEDVRQEYGLDR